MAQDVIRFKKSRFSTRLPVDHLYTASHSWIQPRDDAKLRIGMTKFATRMLGELVEIEFSKKPGDPVSVGEVIGWIEGFKAVSDIYAVGKGIFSQQNEEIFEDPELLLRSPYGQGWLYEIQGSPDDSALTATQYSEHLDHTIQAMLDAEKA